MTERLQKRSVLHPSENYNLHIGHDRDGTPLTLPDIAEVFKARSENAQYQAELARKSILRTIKQGNASPDDIVNIMTNNQAREEIEIWCKGSNIPLKIKEIQTPEGKYQNAKRLLIENEDLIKKLGPHLRQVDLARILAIKRYREADEETLQTLTYGTYHLLGEVLGPRRHYNYGQEKAITPINLPELPEEIFTDELTRNILIQSEVEAVLPIFQKSKEEGFKYLAERKRQTDNPLIHEFISALEKEYQEGLSLIVPGFKDKIPGSQKDIPDVDEITYSDYPAPHQQLYAYRFCHKPEAIGKVDLLAGEPRTMKTGAFIYAMKAAGTQTNLVVCPASLRDNWEREIREKHEEPVEIVRIESERQFRHLIANGVKTKPNYVILSYSLLSRFSTLEARKLFPEFIRKLGADSLGADEIHLAKEPTAECTKQLNLLSRCLPESAPRIAMTATFVVNTIEDLDEPVRMLLPYKYLNPGDFTRAARNDPHLVSALLYGSKLITRWTAEAILGDKMPPFEAGSPREEPVPFSPFHQEIYDFVHQDGTIEDKQKRGMLRQASLDPQLMRRHYHPESVRGMIGDLKRKLSIESDERKQEIIEEKIKALDERIVIVKNLYDPNKVDAALTEAYDRFIQWKLTQDIDAVFDEDFLVKIGYGKLVLWTFLNIPEGVDAVVKKAQIPLLTKDWTGLGWEGLYSSKYRRLKEILDEKIASGQEKVIIFSGFCQTNITTGIEDLEDTNRDEELAFYSLYDHLRMWYGDNTVLKIDGSVSIKPRKGEEAKREQVRKAFRLNPSQTILLATARASRLGIDLTIPPTKANKHFKRLSEIWLDLPDTDADLVQGICRGKGPGQIIPLEVIIMKSTNAEQPRTLRYGFFDSSMTEALEFKHLIAQMTIDAIPLTPEQETFVKSYMTNLKIDVYPQTPRNYLREKFFVDIRGKGAKRNLEYLEKVGFEGMTNEDFFVTYYTQDDETSLAGHNAKAASEIIKRYQEITGKGSLRIASIGAGSGILQATLGVPITNVDMIPGMLEFARHRLRGRGEFIQADAANLPLESGLFDVADASMMLHWTNNNPLLDKEGSATSERATILQELNRITKESGLVTISVPSTYLTAEAFGKWRFSLEKYFGFRTREDIPSGLLRATDYRPEPISWIFNLEKVAEPQTGFATRDLRFGFEQIVSEVSSTKGRNGNGTISVLLPIPHSTFEIIQPENGQKGEFSYQAPIPTFDIEKELLGENNKHTFSGEEIISQLGVEEYGHYRRLRRIARSRWNLNQQDADQLAIEVIQEWAKSGTQKYTPQRILTEFDIMMEESLVKRKKS